MWLHWLIACFPSRVPLLLSVANLALFLLAFCLVPEKIWELVADLINLIGLYVISFLHVEFLFHMVVIVNCSI